MPIDDLNNYIANETPEQKQNRIAKQQGSRAIGNVKPSTRRISTSIKRLLEQEVTLHSQKNGTFQVPVADAIAQKCVAIALSPDTDDKTRLEYIKVITSLIGDKEVEEKKVAITIEQIIAGTVANDGESDY